ncbi:hypothetical protein CTheo_9018 [Ceratobasidium theobromae]|uniref:Fungal-type protein kinase domain-containing protein n=1 Tax=Ceratobasidium theobromae TaxID=1582974 RepID=A0A5N5Q7T3_9AGAM|nr:hypothetical protein CTheo_9018 [Ceratobasidium theobromae]
MPSQSRSRSKISSSNPLSVTTESPQQKVIRHLLRSELNGAVSHQPNFADALLPCSDEYLEQILRRCNGLDLERNKWSQSPPTGSENNFYGPTVDVLNAIGLAVHSVTPDSSGYVEFRARNSRPLGSRYPGMDTYPDIIRCQRPDAPDDVHWQDIDMFVEVKKDNSRRLVTESIEQSARYARALFAHRIDRRFIRTLVVCGKTAVFLHFDRSGLIYSDDVDIYEDPRGFVRAFAGLLLLKGSDAGYNPIFTNIWRPLDPQNPNAPRLDYTVKVNGEEYKVVDVLCIRKSVRGRATLVLALQRLERAEGDNTIDAVLKLIWRDQSRFAEGVILKEFIGVYGVCQVMYEADAMIGGVADIVCSRSGLYAGPRGNVFGPETASVEIKGAKADDCRVHSMLLMQPGRPLSQAGSPFELLAGMIGALMGHWALVNKQVQHRDISANNILLALNDYEYKQPEWEKLKEGKLEELAREFKVPKWDEIFKNAMDEQYEKVEKLTWEFE